MARLRLNQEYRNKIANRMRVHLEQEETQEKENFYQMREQMRPMQDQTWNLAKEIVSRHYTPEDIKMAYHLQNKFQNVDTILYEQACASGGCESFAGNNCGSDHDAAHRRKTRPRAPGLRWARLVEEFKMGHVRARMAGRTLARRRGLLDAGKPEPYRRRADYCVDVRSDRCRNSHTRRPGSANDACSRRSVLDRSPT